MMSSKECSDLLPCGWCNKFDKPCSDLSNNKSIDINKVNKLEELFNKCASKLVSEDYKNGYLEALNHIKEEFKL